MQHIDTQNCNKWKSKMQPEKWTMIQMRLVCKQWFIMAFKIWYLITFYSYTCFSFHRTFWTESCSTIYCSHLFLFHTVTLYGQKHHMGHLKTTRSSWNIYLCSTIFQHGYVHQPVKFSWLNLAGFKGQELERTGGKGSRYIKMHIRDKKKYWFIFRPISSEKSCGGC